MSDITCPHCQAVNHEGNAFCQSCGKAVPRTTGGPRVLSADALPQSAAGHVLLSDELTKQMKRVFNTLLGVGILQLVAGVVLIAVLKSASRGANDQLPLLAAIQIGVALLFISLAIWARKSPLPAAVVGLTLYGTLVAINVVQAVSRIGEGVARSGIGGIGVGWLDVLIMIFLAQGMQAAIRYRKLQQSAPGQEE